MITDQILEKVNEEPLDVNYVTNFFTLTLQPAMAEWSIKEAKSALEAFSQTDPSLPMFDLFRSLSSLKILI